MNTRRSWTSIGLMVALSLALGLSMVLPLAAQETETRVASALCGIGGNRYDDVRFTLSTPSRVGVRFDPGANWWIRQEPAGPIVAQVSNGEAVIPLGAPTGGGTLKGLTVDLGAGTFVLHCDCGGTNRNQSSVATLSVAAPPPAPSGPAYSITARAHAEDSGVNGWIHGYNDRIFLLTARQVVSFSTGAGAGTQGNGWIADSSGTVWWAMDDGTLQNRSTLDLPAGVYCLHVDYYGGLPVQISDQWTLKVVGPTQPGGATTTTTAIYNPNPIGNASRWEDAAFTLAAPQLVTLSVDGGGSPSYYIVDTAGIQWYQVFRGLVQSCSAEVSDGVLLPAGTYQLHAEGSETGGRVMASVTFVGTTAATFTYPSGAHCPCYKDAGAVKPVVTAQHADVTDETLEGGEGCKWWDVGCHVQAARRAIERRIEAMIEQMIAEMFREILGDMCASSWIPLALCVGGMALGGPRRRRG